MSPQQFSKLVEDIRAEIVESVAYSYGSDPADVEDALQDIVLRVLEKPQRFQSRDANKIRGFLWKAVTNRLRDKSRQQKARTVREARYVRLDP